MKMYCPRCDSGLVPRWLGKAQFHLCGSCKGLAITRYAVGNLTGPGPVRELWQEAVAAGRKSECSCPSCLRKMLVAYSQQAEAVKELDLCPSCNLLWFDHGEYDEIVRSARAASAPGAVKKTPAPALPPQSPGAPVAAPEVDDGYGAGTVMLALVGLPVEQNVGPLARYPMATRLLVALCVLCSVWGFSHYETVLHVYAFRAGLSPIRSFFSSITHFFVHADWWHLLGNMYFLWVFGDDVENELGHEFFLGLVAVATLVGCFLFTFSPTASQVPVVGASGGISGLIAYYMIRFPYRRFRIMFFFMIFAIPAWIVGGMFFFKDLLGVAMQMSGASRVSHLSHLGGALVGLLAAMYVASRDRA